MGAGSSTRRVDAVLNMIAETVIDSQSLCLAAAENKVLIDIGGAQNVTVENLFIDQVADASVNCTNDSTIQLGSLHDDISEKLNGMVQSANSIDSDADETKIKLINDVVKAVNQSAVSACITSAVNEFEATAKNVTGDVNIVDLNINQVATAHMDKCLNSTSIKVSGVPLRDYLEEALAPYNVVPPPGKGAPVACDAVQQSQMMSYGAIGAALLLTAAMITLYAKRDKLSA
jgi:hypothetical protein